MGQNQDAKGHKPLKFSQPSESIATAENPPKLVYLPGLRGIPVRGAPAKIIAPEELKTYELHRDVHFRIFDLAKPEDLAAYERLMTACASKPWVEGIKEYAEGVGVNDWRIGVKWMESFMEPRETGVFVMTDDTVGVI